jgi:hypothetical protein
VLPYNPKTDVNAGRSQNFGQPVRSPNPGGNQPTPGLEQPGYRKLNLPVQPGVNPPVNNYRPAGGNSPVQSQNNLHESTQPQLRQYNPPVSPGGNGAQNDWRQTRSVETPAVGVPVQHSAPVVESRQFVAPSAPNISTAPRVEPHPNVVETAPRSYTPPPQPAPAPSPSQPRNVVNAASGSGQNPDKQYPANH